VSSDERWLAAVWPFVHDWLPAPPGAVVEIGCGPLGGFVPMLRAAGYDGTGVDPEAPDGPWYRQAEFEHSELPGPAAAVVACTSLHHVADPGEVLGLAAAALAGGGTIVVVEWAWERFDEATARWCFDRLPGPTVEHNWLRHRHDEWRESGLPWESYCRDWAAGGHLHAAADIFAELGARFDQQFLGDGPMFFADLDGVSEADEQAAIDSGAIQPGRVVYVGRRR
jgi:SAM-dependent methyltransferase